MNPSLPPAVLAQLEVTFRAEADDRLREMQAALDDRDGALAGQLDLLFRHAHSLKGAAAAIGWDDVAALAHDFESHLEAARAAPATIDRGDVQAMLDDLGHAIGSDRAEVIEEASRAAPVDQAHQDDGFPGDASADVEADEETHEPEGVRVGMSQPGSTPATEEIVRVGARGLDAIAADVGDLALTADEWRRLAATSAALSRRVAAVVRSDASLTSQQFGADLASLARDIREQTRRTDRLVESVGQQLQSARMEGVDALLGTLAREARRLARQLDRPLEVTVEGGDVQADRRVIDRLRDPLLHLVRNAIDHGGDAPEDRRRRDKPAALSLRVEARTAGSSLVIHVSDDGCGLDVEELRAQAVERGFDIRHLDEDGIKGLIFAAGFSTAAEVTEVSGRGVGLAAVRQEVEALYGSVQVSSEQGHGSTFRIEVPQGISGVECLIVGVADRLLAVPVSGVLTVRTFKEVVPSRVGGRSVVVLDGVARPVVAGSTLVEGAEDANVRFGVVVVHAGRTSVLAVEELVAQLKLVVKQLPGILGDVDGVSGAAVLGDGGIVPVLLPSALVELESVTPDITAGAATGEPDAPPRLLVVDDSSTTRTLIRTILSAAGFDVETASDGWDGLERLRAGGHDLVVSDIEMPIMDGFDLTRAIRGESALAATPVVLVSSRAEADDRAASAEAGADAHLDKGAFDQGQLVAVIRDLLG